MSRRRGEFEHRTSIFEGAFRAWSHLGGLSPEDVENKPTNEIDPLTYPIDNDVRLLNQKKSGDIKEPVQNPDGSPRREYPYEPLPRSGLAHPYVQAILSPYVIVRVQLNRIVGFPHKPLSPQLLSPLVYALTDGSDQMPTTKPFSLV